MEELTTVKKDKVNEQSGCGLNEKAAIIAICKKLGITDEEINAEK